MFHDLDSTLAGIVADPEAPSVMRGADVSFETPDRNYGPSQTTLNLFLHEVRENRDLRDPEPIRFLRNGEFFSRAPPLRVDCAYLVTAWSNKSGALRVVEEHELLGQALAWFSRFGTIPDSHLLGSLAEQPFPPPTLVAQVDSRHAVGEFWTALGIAPRVAFALVATVALDLTGEEVLGPEVAARELRIGVTDEAQESSFNIGGTVRDAGSKALIVDATVSIDPTARGVQTGPGGRFRFSGLAAGSYTLVATASGFQTATATVEVPATAPGAYDLELSAA